MARRILLVLTLTLAACAAPPPAPEPAPAPTPAPEFPWYRTAENGWLCEVTPDTARLEVRAYRAGPLARLGHNHIMESTALTGWLFKADDPDGSRGDVALPVASLDVDPAALRRTAGEGFDSLPSAEDVAGTRRNMLGEALLDAEHHPFIVAHLRRGGEALLLDLDVRGEAREVRLPVRWSLADGRLSGRARGRISHTALGLTPFSALGGALRVADELDVTLTVDAPCERR